MAGLAVEALVARVLLWTVYEDNGIGQDTMEECEASCLSNCIMS
jgi:hypothetical protein